MTCLLPKNNETQIEQKDFYTLSQNFYTNKITRFVEISQKRMVKLKSFLIKHITKYMKSFFFQDFNHIN